FNVFTANPVIDLMPDQHEVADKGGTMRLGLYPARLEDGSKVREAYGTEIAYDRHRHRFEVNNGYRDRLGEAGMWFSGVSPDGRLVEYIELRDHPWFVATQAHPELKSRPNRPHPVFRDFVGAAASHAGLSSSGGAVDELRRALESDRDEVGDRALLAFATDGNIERAASDLTDRIMSAERYAVINWRGEEIRYRDARDRISTISERAERNGLFEQWLRAVEAINPLRIERLEATQAAAVALGYDDQVEMVRTTRGWNPDELAAVTRGALNASETGYYAAMRRLLARA